jgi:hypothetical protein
VTDAHVTGTIDGFELARLVRERWPAIAVVMMSGHSDASSGPVPEGADFIAKPYLFEHLAPTDYGYAFLPMLISQIGDEARRISKVGQEPRTTGRRSGAAL